MRVLITGASGLIGGRLARHLSAVGHDVVLASRDRAKAFLPANLPFMPIDLDDSSSLDRACTEVDAVVHAAGMNAADCQMDPERAFLVNAIGTGLLAASAKRCGVGKFFYLSTAHVYTSPLVGSISEATATTNKHPYATSHLAGEVSALDASQEGGMNVMVLRLSNAFGAPIHPAVNCWTLVANDLCRQWAVSNALKLSTDGRQERDFVTLTSLSQTIERLIGAEFRSMICNLGGQSWSVLDFASRIQARAKLLGGSPSTLTHGTSGGAEAGAFTYHTERLRDLAGIVVQNYDAEIDALLLFCERHFGAGR